MVNSIRFRKYSKHNNKFIVIRVRGRKRWEFGEFHECRKKKKEFIKCDWEKNQHQKKNNDVSKVKENSKKYLRITWGRIGLKSKVTRNV